MLEYKDLHKGKTAIIFGLGPSTDKIIGNIPDDVIKIGVNDIKSKGIVDYFVCVDKPTAFTKERLSNITSNIFPMFTQLNEWQAYRKNNVYFNLGLVGGENIDKMLLMGKLNYSRTSPFVACCLAIYMGCDKIGLAGVDLTDHHLHNRVREIDGHFRQLNDYHKIYNLSEESALESLEKCGLEFFLNL